MKARFTPEWAEKIALEYVELFVFKNMLCKGCVSLWEFNDHRIYVIFVCPIEESDIVAQDDQIDTFIHELLHVFHYIWGLPQTEYIIERKTKRFLSKHNEFSRNLFRKILASSKCYGTFLTKTYDEIPQFQIKEKLKEIEKELEKKYGRS